MRRNPATAALAALAIAPVGALAQTYLGLSPTQNASGYRKHLGEALSFVCPATDGGKARLYGTDTYTDDSPICAAAIHAGALRAGQAGVVTIVIGNGAKSFKGSERHGIASLDYGAWPHSYSFAPRDTPGSISWRTVWNGVPADFTQPIEVRCPGEGDTAGPVWGTDVYTRDSTICVAAVHAGAIRPNAGGVVTLRRAPAPASYPGSDRYGITSKAWGSSADAFAVAASSAAAPVPPPPAAVVASRTITLAGFTAVGSASQPGPIASRAITLPGWTAVGSAPSGAQVASRTITLPGWIATGSAP